MTDYPPIHSMKHNPDDWVEWIQPINTHGDVMYCRCSIASAINTQKLAVKDKFTFKDDEDALEDFMVVNWACFIPNPKY